jgi:hypothetical protein
MDKNSMDKLPMNLRLELLDAYGKWIQEYVDQGYKAYLITFMFNHLPGHWQSITKIMMEDVEQFYRTLLKWVVRKPRTAPAHRLPILVALRDRPVRKRLKLALDDLVINDGLHIHGIILIPPNSRLKELDEHVRAQSGIYTNRKYTRIRHIDVQQITKRVAYAAGYGLKGLKYDATANDDVLILPLPKKDVPPKERREPATPKELMHW